MSMLRFTHKGDFSKTTKFLRNAKKAPRSSILEKYAQKGVDALSKATPAETGMTAASWTYKIKTTKTSVTIDFVNTNVNKGVPIAIILQYGHATGNGGWVEGRDYINPAIQPIFDELANELWREVTKL